MWRHSENHLLYNNAFLIIFYQIYKEWLTSQVVVPLYSCLHQMPPPVPPYALQGSSGWSWAVLPSTDETFLITTKP